MSETSIKIARTVSRVGRALGKDAMDRKDLGKRLSRLTKSERMLVAATHPDLAGIESPRTQSGLNTLLSRYF